MKFTVNQKDLLRHLEKSVWVITGVHILPMLNTVYLNVEGDKLEIKGSDGVVSIRTIVVAKGEEDGSVCVMGKAFLNIIKSLSEGEIQIHTTATKCIVQQGKTKVSATIYDSKDYPASPVITEHKTVTVKTNEFLETVNLASSCMGTNVGFDTNATLFELTTNGDINITSTDGRRLCTIRNGEKEVKYIVPAKTVYTLRFLDSPETEISFGENLLIFKEGSTTIRTTVLDVKYPDYAKVLPKESETKMTINREELLKAVKRANLLVDTSKADDPVVLGIGEKLEVQKHNKIFGSVEDEIDLKYNGQPIKLGFNGAYLVQMLNTLKDTSLTFDVLGEEKPIVYRKDNLVYMLLPVKI